VASFNSVLSELLRETRATLVAIVSSLNEVQIRDLPNIN
jgi:hypothetical protein